MQATLLGLLTLLGVLTVIADFTPGNKTKDEHRELKTTYFDCTPPPNAPLSVWYRDPYTRVDGCWSATDSDQPAVMLKAYRSGGEEGIHWKYWEKNDENRCLKDWTYYEKDGTTVVAKIKGYTTTLRDKKPWCALPVNQGGKQGYQWEYCNCKTHERICIKTVNSPVIWRYDSGSYHNCAKKKEERGYWAMLNAYQSGGKEGVHWKYANRYTDLLCVKKWAYYATDGTTVIAEVENYNTTVGDKKPWCMLPEYRANGVEGKRWDFCACTDT